MVCRWNIVPGITGNTLSAQGMLFETFLMENIFVNFPTHILNHVFCSISLNDDFSKKWLENLQLIYKKWLKTQVPCILKPFFLVKKTDLADFSDFSCFENIFFWISDLDLAEKYCRFEEFSTRSLQICNSFLWKSCFEFCFSGLNIRIFGIFSFDEKVYFVL